MNDKAIQRLTLICMCFCCVILCAGALIVIFEGVPLPSGLVEIILGLAGFIFAFLAASPLQK